ncbi:MAG TPA: CRISPR-associated endonuclease Cas2 [Thermotoga sp.]|nr:CRISPR-associated endonuclease Cas2 [Thermotoga sp.]
MFVILTYDFNEKRVQKALKICRKYLKWVQNSVFEGNITLSKLEILKDELSNIMDKNEDSVRIYILKDERFVNKEMIGFVKDEDYKFI